MKEALYALTKTYPMGGNGRLSHKRTVNLEISTLKELPDKFYNELNDLIIKHVE